MKYQNNCPSATSDTDVTAKIKDLSFSLRIPCHFTMPSDGLERFKYPVELVWQGVKVSYATFEDAYADLIDCYNGLKRDSDEIREQDLRDVRGDRMESMGRARSIRD